MPICVSVLSSYLIHGSGPASSSENSCKTIQLKTNKDRKQEEGGTQQGLLSSFFLHCAGISKSLESVLSLGPRPTGGGSSPPELRHARAVPQGPPGLPPRPPFTSNSSQPSQPPRERPPWPKRESPHNHRIGMSGASKATISSGGLLPDPEWQRKITEVRSH